MGNNPDKYPSIWDCHGESVIIELIHADCLDVDWPQVDAIITDVPYGTTACKWDIIIPFDKMWAKIKGSLKPRGAFVTTASQPFTSALVMSNPKWYRHSWVWEKSIGAHPLLCNVQPMKYHEDVLIFGKNSVNYYPQKTKGKRRDKRPIMSGDKLDENWGGSMRDVVGLENINDLYYPRSVFYISNANQSAKLHPTQKPVALYEYLIKTYTNEGDTVLDFCMGSGTTGQACINTGRNFFGIEKDEKYYNIAKERLGL